MTVCRARATGSIVTGTFEERPRVVVPMMMCSGVMDGGEPCVVQGRVLPWAGDYPSVPSSLAASSGNTTLATPDCGRRPLAGVIPGHKQCGPVGIVQREKIGKSRKVEIGKTRKAKKCEK